MENQKVDSYQIHYYEGHAVPEGYHNYILSKWMRSYRHGNEYIKLSDSDDYYLGYSLIIKTLLNKPGVEVRFAVLSDDYDNVLGFSVLESLLLHYVYVQTDYRKKGIGKKLLPRPVESFTHLTKTGILLWPTKLPNAKFKLFGGVI